MSDRKYLNYTRKGSGTPLVMQHGYFGSSELWQAQIDYFANYFDVVAPDLAGFGQSAKLQAPDSIPACAQSLFDLLDSLAIDRSYGWRQPEALWNRIPDASLAVLPGCAHNAHMEKPDMFNMIVHDFLRDSA